MSDAIALKQEELDELKKIQSKYQEKLYLFGQLYLERIAFDEKLKQLSDAEAKAREEYLEIQKEEQAWVNKIAETYGDGSLSLADGTFTPAKK